MHLGYSLNIEQTQKLIMTPELRQAITVLQLPAAELVQYIENAMLENPLLEVPEDSDGEEGEVSFEVRHEDFTSDWCDYLSECGQFDRSLDREWAEEDDRERNNFERFVAQAPTLHEYLTYSSISRFLTQAFAR
ncbi:MAG: hypothetical protein ACPLTR_06290 [Thermacetogeniaceae bacterium]